MGFRIQGLGFRMQDLGCRIKIFPDASNSPFSTIHTHIYALSDDLSFIIVFMFSGLASVRFYFLHMHTHMCAHMYEGKTRIVKRVRAVYYWGRVE